MRILYKMRNEEHTQFLSFRLEVVKLLLKLDPTESISRNDNPPTRLVGRHFHGTSRKCHLCSLRKITRRMIYICPSCDTPLCAAPCFEEPHTTLPKSSILK